MIFQHKGLILEREVEMSEAPLQKIPKKVFNTSMLDRNKIIIGSLLALFGLSILLTVSQNSPSFSTSNQTDFLPSKEGIAVIDIFGPIAFSSPSQTFFPVGTNTVIKQLQDLQEDDNVKGLVIRVNSPGGTVGASQELHQAIKNFKEKTNVPVVTSIGDVGASGGYYAGMAADTIFANPGSLVGSIGVILGNINVTELADKYGVDFQVYKSGPYKDSLSSWRHPSLQEEIILQSLVENVHSQFVKDLATDRNISINEAKKLATGQIFTGQQAQLSKLVDHLGSFQDAITLTAKAAGIKGKPHIIKSNKQPIQDVLSLFRDQIGSSFKNAFNPAPSIEYR